MTRMSLLPWKNNHPLRTAFNVRSPTRAELEVSPKPLKPRLALNFDLWYATARCVNPLFSSFFYISETARVIEPREVSSQSQRLLSPTFAGARWCVISPKNFIQYCHQVPSAFSQLRIRVHGNEFRAEAVLTP